ncbi:MAG: transaldolase [Betaproteobacteria bacterium]|nr:MAG: transaldolase [Betaproteobacteria bacterium]
MKALGKLKIKIFADGADKAGLLANYRNPLIKGFTTNPTLMRKSGISDYEGFARDILSEITDRPISLEVFSDEFDDMERQALKINGWGENVYVKIPVTNTRGESAAALLAKLSAKGVKLNVTAIMTLEQVREVSEVLADAPPCYISVFAGRIADTGRDPTPLVRDALALMASRPQQEMIWASPREVLNVVQADELGCHIITVTNDLIAKLRGLGKDLSQFSLETVKMFYDDAVAAGFKL